MRIAFYAPMKPPDAPNPSGDRRMARLLIAALGHAGHDVTLASRFRVWQGAPDEARQRRLGALGARLGARLAARWWAAPAASRPELWLSYPVHYKAPDWIGPAVSRALGIPYVIAEASHAPKRAGGPWAVGHEAAAHAIHAADAIIGPNPVDAACVTPLLRDGVRWTALPPFVETAPLADTATQRARHRRALCAAHGIDPASPVLLAVAMMRPGDKLKSYRVLAAAMARLDDRPWTLVIAGDGVARAEVEALFTALPAARVRWLGERAPDALAALYAAADILVWPAINEAYGMAILEAQAAGLAVIAGRSGGVAGIVRDGKTGLLTPAGDDVAFAAAVAELLGDAAGRQAMGETASATAARDHSLDMAAAMLDAALRAVAAKRRAA
ncbi:MAG: glycosyltransferase family 4 protein [Alphaproteobacteria bacterium]